MELMNITTYTQLRHELNIELGKAANSFVRIGYLLKIARDEDLIKDGGYSDVNEFAAKEFGIDKTQVSRFIRINDRFSIGGYSEHLKVEYQDYGSAKLSLMLTLPDAINEELSPEYSKSDIQAIKEEYEEEQKVSDIEVMLEEKDEDAPDEFIAMIVKQLNDEHPEPAKQFKDIMTLAQNMNITPSIQDIKEDCYCAAGDSAYNIRIPGQGRFMICMKDEGITILNMRTMEKSPLSWQEFLDAVIEDVKGRTFAEETDNQPIPEKKDIKKPEKPKVQKATKPVQKEHKSVQDPVGSPANEEILPQNEESSPEPTKTIHRLKILPEYFNASLQGIKNFELRRDDRGFKVGDLITLEEWDGKEYTGREIRNREIKYIFRNAEHCFGLMDGYVIIGF